MSCAAEVVGQLLSSRSWLGVIGRVGWRMIKIKIMILIGKTAAEARNAMRRRRRDNKNDRARPQ
jgi:hypothetical protein